jgi:hypothetical protein
MTRTRTAVLLTLLALQLTAVAVAADHGIMVRAANVYLSPDASSEKLITIDRGREVALFEKSGGFQHVLATISQPMKEDKDVSGWILDKGYVTASTPNGDQILFGEAVDSENEASRRGGRKGAAGDGRRLYYRVFDYFPNSPLAGEALYRSADIQWQLDRADIDSRPARQRSSDTRPEIDEERMRLVKKKFPNSKWSDLAEFHLLENKLCGDWMGESRCPLKEAEIYEKYADNHPTSPAAAEAYYNAAIRYADAMEIFKSENQQKKIPEVKIKASEAAKEALRKNASPDWNSRAQALLFKIEKSVPVYGTQVE